MCRIIHVEGDSYTLAGHLGEGTGDQGSLWVRVGEEGKAADPGNRMCKGTELCYDPRVIYMELIGTT